MQWFVVRNLRTSVPKHVGFFFIIATNVFYSVRVLVDVVIVSVSEVSDATIACLWWIKAMKSLCG